MNAWELGIGSGGGCDNFKHRCGHGLARGFLVCWTERSPSSVGDKFQDFHVSSAVYVTRPLDRPLVLMERALS